MAAVTSTVTVQLPAAGICAPVLRDTEPDPATAVTVPLGQVVAAAGVVATTRPLGKVSVRSALKVEAVGPALFSVMVSVLVTLVSTLVGANALLSVGACEPPFGTLKVSGTVTTGRLVALLPMHRVAV